MKLISARSQQGGWLCKGIARVGDVYLSAADDAGLGVGVNMHGQSITLHIGEVGDELNLLYEERRRLDQLALSPAKRAAAKVEINVSLK